MNKSKLKIGKVIGALFLTAFFGLVFFANAHSVVKSKFSKYSVADGVVSSRGHGTSKFTYEFSVNGRAYWGNKIRQGGRAFGVLNLSGRVDDESEFVKYDKIKVYYNPNNPYDNLMYPYELAYGVYFNVFAALFFLLFIIVGLGTGSIKDIVNVVLFLVMLLESLVLYSLLNNYNQADYNPSNYHYQGLIKNEDNYLMGLSIMERKNTLREDEDYYYYSSIKKDEIEKDHYKRAEYYFSKSCKESKNSEACMELIYLLKMRSFDVVNKRKKIKYYKKIACDLGKKTYCN